MTSKRLSTKKDKYENESTWEKTIRYSIVAATIGLGLSTLIGFLYYVFG